MIKGCFINNSWVETGEKLSVLSPWSGEPVGEVSLAAEREWEAALAAAQKAAITLKALSSLERPPGGADPDHRG
jgi:acyl-CoA reductase-like NAD-dependent aldehyde dehydrogenase